MKLEKGFTLVEVLIAATIVGISISILVSGFTEVNDTLFKGAEYSYLSTFAATKLRAVINGIELSYSGYVDYQGRSYQWYIETEYLDSENLSRLKLTIQSPQKRNIYSIQRLVWAN
ncbi:prepilin-type N-terminal cleavage/methylation domain-containing protein [Halanaerobacter jeridensis]|uniref:Prepilin-type N-terminal cleavage/methylation domain-containing protein n=1 Tax=Halanaerobacter jeridensis TaxID=706427 RepID=A0A938XPU5_9FIRM|nr:prepilin-type N-terminal cleavage/methylation domain-containing protein [Halanaerobacter jeridensis]MBM7557518.1 prepilin-type N-terminal cleavage/methylation domain-containing protein [Halanaerobacter jeridensis]